MKVLWRKCSLFGDLGGDSEAGRRRSPFRCHGQGPMGLVHSTIILVTGQLTYLLWVTST